MIPKVVEINSRKIGQRFSPYVVAELSGNHDGSLEKALKKKNVLVKVLPREVIMEKLLCQSI